MKRNYKTWIGMLLVAGTLLACAPAAFSQVSVGIQIGSPPPPRLIAVHPHAPIRRTCGLTATGIRHTVIITGTEATGRVHHMSARYGSFHIMKRAATTVAIGEVRTGVSSTTITGTMTTIATTVAGTKTTASTKAGTKKITTTTIATEKIALIWRGTFFEEVPRFFCGGGFAFFLARAILHRDVKGTALRSSIYNLPCVIRDFAHLL